MGFNLETFLMLLAMILTYAFLKKLLGVSFVDVFNDLVRFIKKFEKVSTETLMARNSSDFLTQSREKRTKSKRYQWYRFSSMLITDLGWQGNKVSPESLLVWVLMINFGAVLLLSKIVSNPVLQVVLYVTLDVWAFALLYLLSRVRSRKRYAALMKAEDLICQHIQPAVVNTLREVEKQVDEIVRPAFSEFLVNHFQRSMSVSDALDELNIALGPRFDNVCKKMKKLNEEGKPGMIDTFKDNIERNAIARKMDIKKEEVYRFENTQFAVCMALLIVVFFYTFFNFYNIKKFYTSLPGQLVIILYLMITVGVLCYTQYQQSKDYE